MSSDAAHLPMRPLIDTHPTVTVQEAEYCRLLGYPAGHELSGRPRELAEFARDWYAKNGKPWVFGRLIEHIDLPAGQLRLGTSAFASRQLHELFSTANAHAAMVVAVSAGPECDEMAHQCWQVG